MLALLLACLGEMRVQEFPGAVFYAEDVISLVRIHNLA